MIVLLKKVSIILFLICKWCFFKNFYKKLFCFHHISSVTGGELFEDIVAREFYTEADAR